jgi:hypothetical protein
VKVPNSVRGPFSCILVLDGLYARSNPATEVESRRFYIGFRFKPTGDQPEAIASCEWAAQGYQHQTLLGATGTGKTYVMAAMIEQLNRPALVLAHTNSGRAPLQRVQRVLPPTRSSTSSATTTTTSLRRTFPRPTPTSRRTRRSTRRLTGCGTRPRRPSASAAIPSSSPASRASTGWARPRSTRRSCCGQGGPGGGTRRILRLVRMQFSRNDIDWTAAPSACAATSSRFIP